MANRLNFKFIFFAGSLFLLTYSNWVFATHETDHRFTVFGIVKDSSGVPQSNLKVMVTDTLTGEGNTVFTDEKGRYEVLLHMHNNNLGDEIKITAGSVVKSIKAAFNPEDKMTERKREVNLELLSTPNSNLSKGWSVAAGMLFLAAFFFLLKIKYQQKRLAKQKNTE